MLVELPATILSHQFATVSNSSHSIVYLAERCSHRSFHPCSTPDAASRTVARRTSMT